MDEICVAKFDVYECRKSDRASALSGAQLIICAAQTPEFPDTIPTIRNSVRKLFARRIKPFCSLRGTSSHFAVCAAHHAILSFARHIKQT